MVILQNAFVMEQTSLLGYIPKSAIPVKTTCKICSGLKYFWNKIVQKTISEFISWKLIHMKRSKPRAPSLHRWTSSILHSTYYLVIRTST